MATAAQIRANTKYARENYDNITIRLEKGTKDRIKEALNPGESLNGFFASIVKDEIEKRSRTSAEDRQLLAEVQKIKKFEL